MATRGEAILDLVLSRDPDLVSNVEVISNLDNSNHNPFDIHSGCEAYRNIKRLDEG